MELLRLHAHGPMTIEELAASVRRTHSALGRKVTLTGKARGVVGRLAAEGRATAAALADLEAEIPYPLSRGVTDIERAFKSFHDRIAEKLAEDPA